MRCLLLKVVSIIGNIKNIVNGRLLKVFTTANKALPILPRKMRNERGKMADLAELWLWYYIFTGRGRVHKLLSAGCQFVGPSKIMMDQKCIECLKKMTAGKLVFQALESCIYVTRKPVVVIERHH